MQFIIIMSLSMENNSHMLHVPLGESQTYIIEIRTVKRFKIFTPSTVNDIIIKRSDIPLDKERIIMTW